MSKSTPTVIERLRLLRAGDTSQRELIVEENAGLVWSVAKKFYNRIELDDAYQLGTIGLLKAINKFDESFGVQFSTYAVPLILGEIRRFLRDDGIIKVSRNLKELNHKILKARDEFTAKKGKEPKISELAKILDVTKEEIVAASEANVTCNFISNNIYDGDGTSEIETKKSTEELEKNVLNKVLIKEMLSTLEPKERQVIVLRYFKEETQSVIGEKLGITQVQVSRIENRVLEKLKHAL